MFDLLKGFGRGVRLLRLAILVVFGLPILVCGAIALGYTWMFGEGDVHVMAGVEPTKVYLDGQVVADLQPGEDETVSVGQGSHTIRYETASGTVDVPADVASGLTNEFVGAGKDACYVELDVTDFYYKSTKQKLPTVYKKFHGDEVVNASGAVFSEAALPSQIDDNGTEYLILGVACEELAADDAQVVAALGYSL